MANTRVRVQLAVSQLPFDTVPEMRAPLHTILSKPPPGYSRELEMREDAPYFNASTYCNHLNLRFSMWLRHPATMALIRALGNYYREASHSQTPSLVMCVKSGARSVHGYYMHVMLHDALSAWCDFELTNPTQRARLPLAVSPQCLTINEDDSNASPTRPL